MRLCAYILPLLLCCSCSFWEKQALPIYSDVGEKLGAHIAEKLDDEAALPLIEATEKLAEALHAAFEGEDLPWYAKRALALLQAVPHGFGAEEG